MLELDRNRRNAFERDAPEADSPTLFNETRTTTPHLLLEKGGRHRDDAVDAAIG
jgi:hypothetical protein